MALIPKMSPCLKNNCSKLEIKEITGIYSSPSNVGGWGSPNITLASVDEATLTIIFPSGTIKILDITTIVNAATIIDGEFIIGTYSPSDLGVSSFGDGLYRYEYVIKESTSTYKFKSKSFSVCKTECCVNKMYEKALDDACGCDLEKKLLDAVLADSLLYAAKTKYACNDIDGMNAILKRVKKLCEFKKCKC